MARMNSYVRATIAISVVLILSVALLGEHLLLLSLTHQFPVYN